MATKAHILISLYIFLTLFSFLVVEAFSSKFVSDFLGSKKGDKVKGLGQIKQYLVKYGYLMHNPSTTDEGFEVLDDAVEEAIRKYQLFYHLDVTGVLDEHTLSLMTKPRCGFPDLINGTTIKHGMKLVLDPTKRSYYVTGSKWDKLNLTWATKPGMRDDARKPIFFAIKEWELVTRFHFVQSNDFEKSDLKIGFYSGNHGDNQPFDGPGGIFAHAGLPPDGGVHFDADENWVIGAVPGRIDIESVALHELGHALGLEHSTVEAAIMWPYVPIGVIKHLNIDDVAGIKALYHFP
ncbi:metalloendoproteinase 5-MMP-like [Impatiens glandulifera]|uniref:metalloendoproteinase 5-MMP-like n=1 Tax=Impatiens glandulifera TaxID=253017 RepID=UPI001FB0A8E5|nr:metalloendoproteinase 5-MMP-like [Impatiens glandulifera]